MIYLIVGGSCAGKTSFTVNSFLGSNAKVYKDLVTLTESDNNILFGDYTRESRTKGTDTISRADLDKLAPQIDKLIKEQPNKNIILEGTKIISRNLFNHIMELNIPTKLYYIRCDKEVSIERNKKNNSTVNESVLKAECTKAENIFYEYKEVFNGEIVDTNDVTDFTTLKMNYLSMPKETTEINKDFAVFILTHGRPDNVITYTTLKKLGYNGKVYLVIDNEDKTAEEYYKVFGKENVVMFDKLAISKEFDTVDNCEERRTVVYARNACFKIAKEKGIKYFLELDDDYDQFRVRYQDGHILKSAYITDIHKLFNLMIEFLDKTKALTVAFAQGGDFIGGVGSAVWKKQLSRKAMNSFFCTTDRPFDFIGRINEDVNTYTSRGIKGDLMFTVANVMINQMTTQANSGGMTDVYLDSGTYVKSFFTVITSPSCTKISTMGSSYKRIHHKINWEKCTPKILNQKYKK